MGVSRVWASLHPDNLASARLLERLGFVFEDRHPDPLLWRLLVDRRHQRRGIGTTVVAAVVDRCHEHGATRLAVRFTDGMRAPSGFWHDRGFVDEGRSPDGLVRTVRTW